MKSVIYIDNDGNFVGLSDSLFDKLASLGYRREVKRVSDIEFNHDKQLWEATTRDGVVIGQHQFRETLIELEREYLNKQIEENYAQNKHKLPEA